MIQTSRKRVGLVLGVVLVAGLLLTGRYFLGAQSTAAMAKRYGHIGAEAQRAALDTLVEPRPAPRWCDASSF